MNKELIQGLQEQAMRVVGYIDGGYTELKSLDPEKFAELIVRECANIAADMSALDIYEEIREHFGVEE